MDPQRARNIFDAVLGMAGPTQALFEAQAADALGELSDHELVTVMTDYVEAKQRLENSLNTMGSL